MDEAVVLDGFAGVFDAPALKKSSKSSTEFDVDGCGRAGASFGLHSTLTLGGFGASWLLAESTLVVDLNRANPTGASGDDVNSSNKSLAFVRLAERE
jgi:hypothetical protein